MNKFRTSKYDLILLGISWGIMAIAAKPAMSQKIGGDSTDLQRLNVASLPKSAGISTKAIDLLSPVELSKYFTDIETRNYQLGQLDLEKFCQDFPYNSKCRGTTPGIETRPNSIPVPVPPPTPPEGSNRSSDSNGQKSGWAIVPEISTLGLGGHVVRKIIPQINARVGINTFGFGFEIEDDSSDISANYDVDLSLFNVSTIADIHPFKSSGFKLSGGLIFGSNDIEGTATVDEQIEVGDVIFNADELGSVDVDIEVTRDVAPYLGIGWGNAVAANKGLGFWFNLGVMFGGSPEIEVTPNVNQNLPEAQRAEVEARVNEEIDDEVAEIEDDLAFIDIYPVVSLGISYQF
ncbi:hypothetical protein I4641_03930 [Waterburya agarophytonicola K14]|uniref:Uncharacterized protein n=1 Tax=Waterburya agarophytonicola KI4 TaxID=2874699 RepID=A0A964FG27_9CYAN|nr:hypothetical protein [Waterburya agarophytonicola]MCC0176129.1 hypothetical protein [Waterburya agarophytonicola KI4]